MDIVAFLKKRWTFVVSGILAVIAVLIMSRNPENPEIYEVHIAMVLIFVAAFLPFYSTIMKTVSKKPEKTSVKGRKNLQKKEGLSRGGKIILIVIIILTVIGFIAEGIIGLLKAEAKDLEEEAQRLEENPAYCEQGDYCWMALSEYLYEGGTIGPCECINEKFARTHKTTGPIVGCPDYEMDKVECKCINDKCIEVLSTSRKLFESYETSEIYLEYPYGWGIQYTEEESFLVFTAPDWTEEEGGVIISYAPIDLPYIDKITEETKKEFSEDFIEGAKEEIIKMVGDENLELVLGSTQIISVSNISSIRIIFTIQTQDLSYKQDTVAVPEGDTYHGLVLVSSIEEYDTYVPYFNHFVDSFIIKNPREIVEN